MRLLKHAPALILCLLCAATLCRARQGGAAEGPQEDPEALRRERGRRLSVNGSVVTKEIRLYPVEQGVGEILALPRTVIAEGSPEKVKGLRLHFSVRGLEESQRGTWSVSVTSAKTGGTWTYDSREDPASDDFWSSAMPGTRLAVRVYSTVPSSTLHLVIDQRIEYEEPLRQKTIVGKKDDTVEIKNVTSAAQREWGRSVALLTFVSSDDHRAYTCTGFLVAPNLLFTNDHCPRTRAEVTRTVVEFDYDEDFAQTKKYKLVWEDVPNKRLPRNADLDFALYRLDKAASGRGFLRLKDDDGNLRDMRPLVIIQHPGGRPKRLASYQCYVKTQTPPVAPSTDFGHLCDTEGGSSGAPVQNTEGFVIGLHHFGYGKTATTQINQAVKAGRILKFIEEANGEVYKLLTSP
jgi:V8-like Glu-specific endopeptidase